MKNKKSNSKKTSTKNFTELSTQANKAVMNTFKNGLTDALGLFNPFESVQLSQVDTLFNNLRYYLLSNFRQILSQMYAEFGIVQTIVDMPVDDALRGGVIFTTQELNEQELLQLHTTMDRANDIKTLGQGFKWMRLYGGSGVITVTEQNPILPLNLKSIYGKKLDFHACDLWELYSNQQNLESEVINPVQLDQREYQFYDVKIHESRVMKLMGITPPSFLRPRLRGWGLSVLEPIVRPLNQFLKATDLAFEVLDEFKLDVFKLTGLAQTLDRAGGSAKVKERVALANKQKNYQNAIVLDGLDDFIQKQLSFSGLAETMEGIRMQLACETHFPQAKLFGEASQGFSSGQDSIENYNAMIESTIRQPAKYDVLRMGELRCMQLFGMIPDDLSVEFKPLRILGAEAEENVKNAKFTRILQSLEGGHITEEEFRENVNKEKLLPNQLKMSNVSLVEEQKQELDNKTDEASIASLPKSKLKAPEVKE